MGIQGGDRLAVGTDAGFVAGNAFDIETQFVQDIDITFTMSGQTDNGLTFGAAIDIDEVAGNVGTDDAGVAIFISGDFGTLTMGDTDGALDWALTEAWVGNAGSINDDETSHVGALGAYGDGAYDGQILRYDYSVGDFGVAISVELDDTGAQDPGYAIGFRYGLDLGGANIDLGLGYQTFTTRNGRYAPGNLATIIDFDNGGDGVDSTTEGDNTRNVGLVPTGTDVDIIGFSVSTTLDSGLSAGLQYSIWDFGAGNPEVTHFGLGVGYTFDALTVSANYGQFDSDVAGDPTISGFGLAAAYDLGGGLSMHLGYGRNDYDVPGVANTATYSLGLAMKF